MPYLCIHLYSILKYIDTMGYMSFISSCDVNFENCCYFER